MEQRFAVHTTVGDIPRAGFPFLVLYPQMSCPEGPLLFLHRYARHRALNTVMAYARSLLLWSNFLAVQHKDVSTATLSDFSLFMNSLSKAKSPHTKREYSALTARLHHSVICRYYTWAKLNGFVQYDIAEGAEIFLPREYSTNDRIRPIDMESDWPRIRQALGPLPSESGELRGRNRLFAEIAISTGLRLDEILSLERRQFSSLVSGLSPFCAHIIRVKRKGGFVKKLQVPVFIVDEILAFISRYEGREGYVFSGSSDQKRISNRRMQQVFERACIEGGVLRTTGCLAGKEAARHSVHDLRHTYATWTYVTRARQGDSNPWIHISDQLGHRSVETTIKTYIHFVMHTRQLPTLFHGGQN